MYGGRAPRCQARAFGKLAILRITKTCKRRNDGLNDGVKLALGTFWFQNKAYFMAIFKFQLKICEFLFSALIISLQRLELTSQQILARSVTISEFRT